MMLRGQGKQQPTARRFIGYGDPQFSPSVAAARQAAMPTLRAASSAQTADFDYRTLPALPETREELVAIAKVLDAATDGDLMLGAQASRSAVLHARLDDRRILAFATHGIKPGDFLRVTRPALAMAFEGRGMPDSLLTTDDIVGLRLNADWVVLSACNTGAHEGRDPGRREFNPQRQPGDELTNPPNSLALFRGQDKAGLGLARTLQEQPGSAARFQGVRVSVFGKGQTLHFNDPLGL
jgi:CHAT domain-containing protein